MNKKELKLVFMGTPQISARILQALFDDGYNITAVITEPDKPFGREQKLTPPAVKVKAKELSLPVFQPEKKINVFEVVSELKPDICVVAAYGKILTKETIEASRLGIINFHASLLPRWRGASPVQFAILNGDKTTGVTIMKIDEGMDTGPILSQVEFPIDEKETTTTLLEKMLEKGIPLLLDTLPKYIDGEIKPVPQSEGGITMCKMIEKEDGKINFTKTAKEEERKLRAYTPWPGNFAMWDSKRLKFLEVELSFGGCRPLGPCRRPTSAEAISGEVFLDENGNLCLQFAKGHWIIKKLQLEGKSAMVGKDFVNGNRDIIGGILE